MKRVKFRKEAERLNVPVEAVVSAFQKSLKEGKVHGIIDTKNQEFIYYSTQEIDSLAKLISTKRIPIKILAHELNVRPDQTRLVIEKLLRENKIKGLLAQDGTFVSNSVVVNLAKEVSKKTGKLDVYEVSQRLSVPEEITVERLSEYVINKIVPYKKIKLADLSRKTKLPEDFVVALLEKLISEKRLTGSIDMVYRTFMRTPAFVKEEGRSLRVRRVSDAWYVLPLFMGFIGGLIAWLSTKEDDPDKATNFLLLGVVITVLGIIFIAVYWSWLLSQVY